MPSLLLYSLVTALSIAEGCVPKYSDPPKCSCGIPFSKRRIIGGVPAKPNQYPWQVALLSSQFSSHSFCGGSLLSSDTVLTAAHCVNGYSLPYVGFPKDDVTLQNAKKIQASQVLRHPYYSNGYSNDFAIIKLSTPVVFDDSTQPICLPNPNTNYDDNLAEVTGWGETYTVPSDDLMTVNVTTMTNEECQELHDKYAPNRNAVIDSNMICAGDPGKDSCQGDSGGPMITLSEDGTYFSQIGVVSWGIGCASSTPGVYSRVTKQLYWIIKQISGQTCPPPALPRSS
jgi:secreted trypsin-like serine protease